ncbi:TPM domain-containing protein [Photobacterium leiognathi]|uniref:TPM domain-containing protein n=1 Tax=Photobacterium leiognathi TaxID=553611 RepID=UPI002980B78D|nr:TPM domain-containing protein [Photobacterium leiognathi]
MKLFTNEQLETISQTIGDIEKTTDAELMTVVATQADDYYFVPTLWAAIIALFIPALLNFTPFWLELNDILMCQLAGFIVFTLLFRIPAIKYRLVPKSVKHRRASLVAREQFLANGIHRTKQHLGVMIFVCEAEHYVEIITDYGISEHISDEAWSSIVSDFTHNVHDGKTYEGFLQCLEQSSKLLANAYPLTEAKNELPNCLVVIGEA